MKHLSLIFFIFLLFFNFSCNNPNDQQSAVDKDPISAVKGSFAYDEAFLRKHNKQLVLLQSGNGQGKVLVSGDYQGRVMTSTATGDTGISYGWINYDLIASGKKTRQFNPVGGEERFWLGPEGGQYSLYFNAGDSFSIKHWQVPAVIDTDSFQLREVSNHAVSFTKATTLKNYAGTVFDIRIERKISILEKKQLEEKLQVAIPQQLQFVGYETKNMLINTGREDWKKEKGLLSIWLLGMFTPSPQTTIIIPFEPNRQARSFITDNYFGQIPAARLRITGDVLFFTCDGKHRSKIGISPDIAKPIAGSFDNSKNLLTLIAFSVNKKGNYVNSKWELQKHPYKGDVVNAYNDGPLADGSQLGPFYELESSSPAEALKKGGAQEYSQVTCHFQGDYYALRTIAKKLLGVDLDELSK